MNQMHESILNSIKHLIGLEEDYTPFDQNIILGINSAIATLLQVGVKAKDPYFRVYDANQLWCDFIDDCPYLGLIKDYVYLKTRHLFDPPTSSAVLASIEAEIKEAEWRIYIEVNNGSES